jgi:hypothetical protein
MLNFGALWPKIIEEDNVIGRKIIILVALLGLRALAGGTSVVLPEKYARDPGAAFALVFVTDLAEPTAMRAGSVLTMKNLVVFLRLHRINKI